MVIKSLVFTTVLVGMTMGFHQAAKADDDDWHGGGFWVQRAACSNLEPYESQNNPVLEALNVDCS
jgi:hypothetical protein